MKKPKIKTPYPGVRYYEHSTRKQRNGQPDRYYSIRYKKDGRTIEEGMGWATEQWNAEKAFKVLSGIKENKKTGAGPQSLSEMRQKAAAERAAAEGYKLFCRPEACPFDLIKYGMAKGILPDVQLPFPNGKEILHRNWDFIARYYLCEYYEGD